MASSSSSSSSSSTVSQLVSIHPYPIQAYPNPPFSPPSSIHIPSSPKYLALVVNCSTNSSPNSSSPQPDLPITDPNFQTTNNSVSFPIEKRKRSAIIRDRKIDQLVKPEPPNFEIGWKRTKPIPLEKPKGYMIMDFLEKLEELMAKEYGSTTLLEKVGEIVAERAREEAEVLRDEGKVEERMVTELFRVLKLMEMDLAMVKAAVKEDTLKQRLERAKARCRQAILVANSF